MQDDKFEIYDDRDLDKNNNNAVNLKSKLMAAVIVVLSLLSVALLLWYGYKNFTSSDDTVKLITADKAEKKIKPQNPGGMEFPDMDKDVFNKFSSETKTSKVERILPAPEEPVTKKELDPNATEEKANPEVAKELAPEQSDEETDAQKPATQDLAPKAEGQASSIQLQGPELPKAITDPKAIEEVPSNVKKLPEGSNFMQQDYNKSAIVKSFRVQLSSLKSEKDAIKLWDNFVKKAEGLLENKKYFIEKKMIENKGLFYRLQVADMASESDAAELCKKLKNKNIDCFIVRPEQ
jgi:cell division septation protein DedD